MVRYYYNKYAAIQLYEMYVSVSNGLLTNGGSYMEGSRTYTFDKYTGKFVLGTKSTYPSSRDEPVYVSNFPNILEEYYSAASGARDAWDYIQYKTRLSNVYERGALIQSNIEAENGTYPNNGRHTDGYWYVRGTIANTAPTTPGAFTQPTGELEIGDLRTISWGVASDTEGNLAGYTLEVSINGGGYAQIGTPTQSNYNYTIPTATSLKFRVKARDAQGLESGYRESATFTVTKPRYFYSKYNAIQEMKTAYALNWGTETATGYYNHTGTSSYIFDPNTGKISASGGDLEIHTGGNGVCYNVLNASSIYKYRAGGGVIYRTVGTVTSGQIPTGVYTRGGYIQSVTAIDGTYPANGRHSDGFWYVRGSRVNQSIAPTGGFTLPASGKVFKPSEVATIEFVASSAPNISLYEVDYKYGNEAWKTLANNASLTRTLTITTDKTLASIQFRVRAKNTNNVYSDYVYSEIFTIEHNAAPTVNLTTPSNNQTLYENDTYIIDGTVLETNVGDTVTVRYQIGAGTERAIKAYLSTGALESFGKQLTFKGGNLYDGTTLIAENLIDGIAHTLKVWATDDKGGTSAIVERTFYVVPNRAPLLTVYPPVIEGNIDSDKIQFTGDFNDLDENEVTVQYRINGGNSVQIATGISGTFEFDISFGQLKIGANDVVVEVIDSYGAKTSKTIKLNKNEVESEQLRSTARYKINPPTGSARGVLLWIQRDVNLDIDVAISMTMQGEAESFIQLSASNTAPLDQGSSIVEDEFYHEVDSAKENIILQIDMERASLEVSDKIYLISGVLD